MVTKTNHGLAFVPALITWIYFISLTLAEECKLNVTQSMVKPLITWNRNELTCEKLWSQLVQDVLLTKKNLTDCNDREKTGHSVELLSADCQQRLNRAKQDADRDRMFYNGSMQKKLSIVEQEIKTHQQDKYTILKALSVIRKELESIYWESIPLSIGVGAPKKALMHYREEERKQQLHEDIVKFVYRDATQENAQLEFLLDFIRILSSIKNKLSLYQLLRPEMLKRPTQRDSYLLMIAALDVGKVSLYDPSNTEAKRLYVDLFEPALKRLKDSVVKGSYDEIAKFAADYPDHFEQVQQQLSTIDSNLWDKLNFNHFVTYPNSLPLAKQRLEAFRMIVQQVNDRNKNNYGERLPKVAREIEQCEQFIQNAKHDSSDLDKLASVKRLFTERDPKRDYEHYLNESKKN